MFRIFNREIKLLNRSDRNRCVELAQEVADLKASIAQKDSQILTLKATCQTIHGSRERDREDARSLLVAKASKMAYLQADLWDERNLKARLQEQNEILSETIAHSAAASYLDAHAKDDAYFGDGFGAITRELRNWCQTHFRGVSQPEDMSRIDEVYDNFLKDYVDAEYEDAIVRSGNAKVLIIFKAVYMIIMWCAFGERPDKLLLTGAIRPFCFWKSMNDAKHLMGCPTSEKRRWAALTCILLSMGTEYTKWEKTAIAGITTQIESHLGVLAIPSSSTEKRLSRLRKIATRAFKLVLELRKQPSGILIDWGFPDSVFDASFMTSWDQVDDSLDGKDGVLRVMNPVAPSVIKFEGDSDQFGGEGTVLCKQVVLLGWPAGSAIRSMVNFKVQDQSSEVLAVLKVPIEPQY